ncbi:Peptide chain release factor subunit 1, partial [Frankliniella fusca]
PVPVWTDNMRGLCLAAVCVVLGVTCSSASSSSNSNSTDRDWWDTGVTVLQRSLEDCEVAKDVSSCLKVKAVRALDRALHTGTLPLFGGVVLVPREESRAAAGAGRALPSLPRDLARRPGQLDSLLWGRVARFLETRSLQLALPRLADGVDEAFEGRYLNEAGKPLMSEPRGRGKLKKMAGPAILIMVMAAYKLAMMMAGVAMLSGKALIVSKVALTLAGVAVLKKLLSHHDHEKTTVEIVKSPQVRRRVSHSHSYSSAHEEDGHNYHDKSWSVGPMAGAGGYSHRSLVDDAADGPQAASPYLMAQDVASKRDYRAAAPMGPMASPMNSFVTGRGVESLSIRSHDPLRIVVADAGDDDLRVHHRQRGLDMPVLPGPASAALGFTEEPMDYAQFGEVDRGAWRGLGSSFMPASDRSLRSAPSSEQQERAVDGAVSEDASNNYQPRSLGSLPAPAA